MTPERTRALLSVFATELADVADGIEGLSDLIGRLIAAQGVVERSDALLRAQAIDALVQRCRALGEVSAGVAAGRELDALLDAVPLAELAGRLKGTGPAPQIRIVNRADVRPASGDVHLFD